MAVCPTADHGDGAMDVTTIGPVSKATFLGVLPLVFRGHHVRHSQVSQRRCGHLELTTDEPLWADGERLDFVDGTEAVVATITVLPGALTVARRAGT